MGQEASSSPFPSSVSEKIHAQLHDAYCPVIFNIFRVGWVDMTSPGAVFPPVLGKNLKRRAGIFLVLHAEGGLVVPEGFWRCPLTPTTSLLASTNLEPESGNSRILRMVLSTGEHIGYHCNVARRGTPEFDKYVTPDHKAKNPGIQNPCGCGAVVFVLNARGPPTVYVSNEIQKCSDPELPPGVSQYYHSKERY